VTIKHSIHSLACTALVAWSYWARRVLAQTRTIAEIALPGPTAMAR